MYMVFVKVSPVSATLLFSTLRYVL